MIGSRAVIPIVGNDVGDVVRIKGVPHLVQRRNADGSRDYKCISDGSEFHLTRRQQFDYANRSDITTNAQWESLGPDVHLAVETDWRLFTEQQRDKAVWRMNFHTRLDSFGPKERRKSLVVQKVIDEFAEEDESGRRRPSVRSVREFDKRWIFSGRNPKSLVDLDHKKGNRREHDDAAWIDEVLNEIIDEGIARDQTISEVDRVADARLGTFIQAQPELPVRSRLRHDRVFGVNRVRTLLKKRNFYEQNLNVLGRKEARRQASGITIGPQGDYALADVEVDHTMMDIHVKWNGKESRPWLTAIIDRYSRLILGFYITIDPPSWYSVLMALRLAVSPKDDYLKRLDYKFEYQWDCFGAPDRIFVDRGSEFRSATLAAFCMVLQIGILDLPRASGDLKGKIERLLGTQGRGQLRQLPGYTGANPKERLPDRANRQKLELHQLERLVAIWIVDGYNARPHSGINNEIPYTRYKRSIEQGNLKFPPPADLLGDAVNPARTTTLTSRGIRLDGLTYRSDALQSMWYQAGGNVQVLVLPNMDLGSQILVHYGTERLWVEGKLVGKYAGTTLDRRSLVQQVKQDKPVEAPEDIARRRQAMVRADDEIRHVVGKPKPPKIPTKPPAKRTTHINRPALDPDASAADLRGYDRSFPVEVDRYESSGPFAEPSLAERYAEIGCPAREIKPNHLRSPNVAKSAFIDKINDTAIHADDTLLKSSLPVPCPISPPDADLADPDDDDDWKAEYL